MNKEFKLADSVSMRFIQIFQEAIMTGIDASDILRQVRVEIDEDGETLVLTGAYKKQVEESYKKMLAHADQLREANKPKIFGA